MGRGESGKRPVLLASDDEGATFLVGGSLSAQEALRVLGLSKPQVARVLAEGRFVRVPGGPEAAKGVAGRAWRLRFSAGHPLREVQASARRAAQGQLNVVLQDSFLLAADKPAGLIVHGDGTGRETLTDRVRAPLLGQGLPGAACRAQAVQRLDEDTTGVVLFSLAEEFQGALDSQVAGHAMHKRYLVMVRGGFPAGVRTICEPIGRDRHDARRMRVSRTGKESVTRVAKLDERGGFSLLGCQLGTGRRHQIRVHLASLGYPIVGDALYGGPRDRRGLMLHAAEESFAHPVTGKPVRAAAPWPARFAEVFPQRNVEWGILDATEYQR